MIRVKRQKLWRSEELKTSEEKYPLQLLGVKRTSDYDSVSEFKQDVSKR